MRRTLLVLCTVIALSTSTLNIAKNQAQPTLPTVAMSVSGVELNVEIAKTGAERYMGLSYRTTLPANAGMLFVFPAEKQLVFTMRNTLIPLSIAYLSKDWVINEIHDMPVGPNQLFPSKRPAQYALEVNQGWFNEHGVAVGDQITLR